RRPARHRARRPRRRRRRRSHRAPPRRPRARRPHPRGPPPLPPPSLGGMAKDRIPTSRISRTARVTGLAAGQAARQLGTATTNLARTQEGKEKALERRHIEAAEQIVSALGTM